jgi:hypothetical protein
MIAAMATKDPKLLPSLNPDSAPSAAGARHLMSYFSDPCVCWPTGLSMYALAAALHLLFSWLYWKRGYARHTSGCLVYWYRPGDAHGSRDEKPPVAFFPGVGAGCLMYDMILHLIETKVGNFDRSFVKVSVFF